MFYQKENVLIWDLFQTRPPATRVNKHEWAGSFETHLIREEDFAAMPNDMPGLRHIQMLSFTIWFCSQGNIMIVY
ncbi:hypothetical protein P8452_28622 [Trifolium repens]|nr:hypothetical protein P8452_28622 [Trifolium repens]